MKLASLKQGGRDGTLIVVNRALDRAVIAADIAPTLQAALDDWSNLAPRLNALADQLERGAIDGFALDFHALAAPLPRAYEFVDGSAYLPHVERVRRARGAKVPESFYVDPLMYQGVSAGFYGPRDPVLLPSEDDGIDLEAEVIVITDDVPMAVDALSAREHIQLVGLINDVSLRNLIPAELEKGFGFLQSKPRSTLSPVLVAGDTTTVLAQAFQDPGAGVGNKVIVPSIAITDGNGGANYAVTLVNFLSGTITPQSITDWRTSYFNQGEITAGLAADGVDADGDGITNLDEYLLGTDPRSATQPPLTITRNGNNLSLIHI